MAETLYVEGSGDECDIRLDSWLRDLLPRTPGIVRKVATRELILTVREFYEQSSSWRVVIGPKNMQPGKAKYGLSPYDAYANIVRVLGVELSSMPLAALTRRPPGEEPVSGSPWGFYVESPDLIRLWPTPRETVANTLTFHVALTPKLSVTHLPRISATHHYDAILDGALGRILAHPAKPYSNLTVGQYHLRRFRDAIAKYKGEAIRGYNGAQPWAFPRFGI